MNLHWLITNLLASLILPPMALILLACMGWIISRRWFYVGRVVTLLSALLMIVLSTSAGASWLMQPLERQAYPDNTSFKPQAIVILGGGRIRSGAEPDAVDQAGPNTLMRLKMGARLHRETRLPILVTGGAPDKPGEPEGQLMARSLVQDFGVNARWVEDQAANTAENAVLSSRILRSQDIRQVLLVTDAVHMPRARMAFARAGIEAIPAPASFIAAGSLTPSSFIPTADALRQSHYALHEWLGLLWYQISLGAVI